MPRSSVNDTMREMMAALARVYQDMNGSLVSGGTSTAYTLTTNAADAALSDAPLLVFRVHAANGVAPTLNRDGLGAKPIRTAGGSALPAGTIAANQVVSVSYNATDDAYNMHGGGGRIIGETIDYAGATAPGGWLLCDGAAVSRTTYAALFAVTATTYGAGNGSTTFNLPDLRGRVVAGKDSVPTSGGTTAARLNIDATILGTAGGAATHALTPSEGPIRNHTHSDANITGGAAGAINVLTTGSGTPHSTSNPTGGEQNGAAHNNVQPTIILNKIIYAGV